MKTITIKLPDSLNQSLNAEANSWKQIKSAAVRDPLLKALRH